MKMKSACFAWLGLYLFLAISVGAIVYRRMPVAQTAVVAGAIGGGIAWIGVGFLAGIRQKFADVRMIRRGLAGEPPVDGEKIAAIGRIIPTGAQPLLSPLTRTPAVAYKYEIQSIRSKSSRILFDGFALIPSAIQSSQGTIRILAYPELLIRRKSLSRDQVEDNAAEYIRNTEFRDPGRAGIQASFKEIMADFKDDDGSIRTDQRTSSDQPDLSNVWYTEQVISPGDRVCAIGRFSVQRGGLVPDPNLPLHQITIRKGEPDSFVRKTILGAFGNLIGAAIFLGAFAAGLVMFMTVVPLEAAEHLAPSQNPTWFEVRLERLLNKRVRIPLLQAGVLDEEIVPPAVEPGAARGRVISEGREVEVRRASATREGDETTVRIDENLLVLKINERKRPASLQISGQTIDFASSADDIDLMVFSAAGEGEVVGRLTYFSDRNSGVAAHVSFRAPVLTVGDQR